jgi:hypothetical protein
MAKQNDVDLQQQGDAIRRFNRFYTRAIGTLHAHLRKARMRQMSVHTDSAMAVEPTSPTHGR